jgi:hypothetical protein
MGDKEKKVLPVFWRDSLLSSTTPQPRIAMQIQWHR